MTRLFSFELSAEEVRVTIDALSRYRHTAPHIRDADMAVNIADYLEAEMAASS